MSMMSMMIGTANFHWKRNRVYDRVVSSLVYETLMEAPVARVVSVEARPVSRWYVHCGIV